MCPNYYNLLLQFWWMLRYELRWALLRICFWKCFADMGCVGQPQRLNVWIWHQHPTAHILESFFGKNHKTMFVQPSKSFPGWRKSDRDRSPIWFLSFPVREESKFSWIQVFLLERNPSSWTPSCDPIPLSFPLPLNTHSSFFPNPTIALFVERAFLFTAIFFAAIYIFLVCHVHSFLPKYCCCIPRTFTSKEIFTDCLNCCHSSLTNLERSSVSFWGYSLSISH